MRLHDAIDAKTVANQLGFRILILIPAGLIGYCLVAPVVVPTNLTMSEAERPEVVEVVDEREAQIRKLESAYHCTRTGLGAGVRPLRTIVLGGNGQVKLASFDSGWAMYHGSEVGTLVSVCAK